MTIVKDNHSKTLPIFLRQLGERVRNGRARLGMTRKMLAQESGVSERYLAQLEGGQGNMSIGLLRQVSEALNLGLDELVQEGPAPALELKLLTNYLGRLTPEDLTRCHDLVVANFGSGGSRGRRLALVGLRGAGKSTLGRMVAERLGCPFIDLAREIESDAGMSLNEIFSLSGQSGFRRLERRCLDRIVHSHDEAVIETGGGLVTESETYEILLETCHTIWLKAEAEEHMARVIAQGDKRPMAGNSEAMADLRLILGQRESLYAKAEFTIDTSGREVTACANELIEIATKTLLPSTQLKDQGRTDQP